MNRNKRTIALILAFLFLALAPFPVSAHPPSAPQTNSFTGSESFNEVFLFGCDQNQLISSRST